jgi:hypothetical protein
MLFSKQFLWQLYLSQLVTILSKKNLYTYQSLMIHCIGNEIKAQEPKKQAFLI